MSQWWPSSTTPYIITRPHWVDSSFPGQNGCHFGRRHFSCILLNGYDRIPIEISLKYVPRSPTDNKPTLGQVMTCRRIGLFRSATGHYLDQWWSNSLTHIKPDCEQGMHFYFGRLYCSLCDGNLRVNVKYVVPKVCTRCFFVVYISFRGSKSCNHLYHSELFRWHWGNHMIATLPME